MKDDKLDRLFQAARKHQEQAFDNNFASRVVSSILEIPREKEPSPLGAVLFYSRPITVFSVLIMTACLLTEVSLNLSWSTSLQEDVLQITQTWFLTGL